MIIDVRVQDYGYWYVHNRDRDVQLQFQQVEQWPQGLEWIFSVAAGARFQVSVDNFDEACVDRESFRWEVRAAAHWFLRLGLPSRAAMFAEALAKVSGNPDFHALQTLSPATW